MRHTCRQAASAGSQATSEWSKGRRRSQGAVHIEGSFESANMAERTMMPCQHWPTSSSQHSRFHVSSTMNRPRSSHRSEALDDRWQRGLLSSEKQNKNSSYKDEIPGSRIAHGTRPVLELSSTTTTCTQSGPLLVGCWSSIWNSEFNGCKIKLIELIFA